MGYRVTQDAAEHSCKRKPLHVPESAVPRGEKCHLQSQMAGKNHYFVTYEIQTSMFLNDVYQNTALPTTATVNWEATAGPGGPQSRKH